MEQQVRGDMENPMVTSLTFRSSSTTWRPSMTPNVATTRRKAAGFCRFGAASLPWIKSGWGTDGDEKPSKPHDESNDEFSLKSHWMNFLQRLQNMCKLSVFVFWVFGDSKLYFVNHWNLLKCSRFAWMLTRRANRVEIPVPDHRICSCGCPKLGLEQLRLWRHSPKKRDFFISILNFCQIIFSLYVLSISPYILQILLYIP